ncbi:MAG: extensin family protein [Myxococcota bacterium]|nr:extensin family protein [Myxococcota bacterium]
MRGLIALLAGLLAGLPAVAAAEGRVGDDDMLASCTAELDRRGITWKAIKRSGIARGVEITGALGGVQLTSHQPLIVDCSLAVSLDEAGRYLRELGIEQVTFSSAYSRRNVRGTNRPSKHSYGLAIDIHTFTGAELGTLRVDQDYEQGLGDDLDCVGRPYTQGGAVMKIMQCQLARSGLFHLVLSPDFDDAHHDHFHLEVKPWHERTALRAPVPAIH